MSQYFFLPINMIYYELQLFLFDLVKQEIEQYQHVHEDAMRKRLIKNSQFIQFKLDNLATCNFNISLQKLHILLPI